MSAPRRTSEAAPPPWWTEADQAEFELVSAGFVDVARLHRGHCPDCRESRERWCEPLRDACDALIDWLDDRMAESEAVWLRRLERAALQVEDEVRIY